MEGGAEEESHGEHRRDQEGAGGDEAGEKWSLEDDEGQSTLKRE